MATYGVFVTGTDTGVGKTFVAAAIAAVFNERGYNPGVMKPVATGCRRVAGELVSADTLCLLDASGATDPVGLVSPFSYEPPVAPTVAAAMADRPIRLDAITDAFERLARQHDVIVVEGIGGIMVPLGDRVTVVDMARDLGLPLIIVARPSLGTINHTLLTVHAAQTAGLDVAAVVLNRYPTDPTDLVLRTNPHQITARIDAPVCTLEEAHNVNIEECRLGTAVELMRQSRLTEIVETAVR